MNPLNHRLAEGIRRVGFRKWYERELLSSHAHLLLTLLATIGLMAAMEAFHDAGPAGKLLDVALFIVCAGIGLWALKRYLVLLSGAEAVANQANCPACGAYARFELIGEDRRTGETQVRCRKCQADWTIYP